MPWTKKDADKHKKGLSDKQKEKWAATANSVLAACLKKGGAKASCEAQAVRIANGTANNNEVYTSQEVEQEVTYTVREETYKDAKHLVVPVIMMVEGVHNGSLGPLFHSISELGKFPDAWNGRPVVIDHPEIEGQSVSANSPEIMERQVVGIIFNTHVDDNKLKAEAWLDEEKLRQSCPSVLAAIQNTEPIEVSIGVFTDTEEVEGDWNEEHYIAIAHNHRPDHLALLPGGRGACSVEDGCGIRVNKKKGGTNVNEEDFLKSLKSFYANQLSFNAEAGYRELVDAARSKIDAMDSENVMHFLQEVYDDFVVYEIRQRIGGLKLYKQGYKFENSTFELTGNPQEVHRKVEYVVLANGSGMRRTRKNNNYKEVIEMSKDNEECTPCVKKKVDALIANEASKYAETDRKWLEALTEEQLDKMEPQVVTKEVTKEVNVLSAEDREILDFVKLQKKEQRKATIAQIQANSEKNAWTEDELNAMSDSALVKVAGLLKKEEPADYSLLGGGGFDLNASGEEPLAPTGIKFEE